jgi:hypothetical protein
LESIAPVCMPNKVNELYLAFLLAAEGQEEDQELRCCC